MRIYLLGFMGAGKTYWGQKLSQSLQLTPHDLDVEIVRGEGIDIPTIFEKYGEQYFRKLENLSLKKLSENDNFVLSCGGGTPCGAGNMDFMNSCGLTLWLNVPAAVMVNRLKRNKASRPLIKDFDDRQLTDFVHQKMEERAPFYEQSKLILNPIKFNIHTLTEKIKSCTGPF